MDNMSILVLWNTLSRKKGGDEKEKSLPSAYLEIGS